MFRGDKGTADVGPAGPEAQVGSVIRPEQKLLGQLCPLPQKLALSGQDAESGDFKVLNCSLSPVGSLSPILLHGTGRVH